MNHLFSKTDYEILHKIVFQPDYPGYKPNVIESPNGDGKLDSAKRYAHIATKYFTTEWISTNWLQYKTLSAALDLAHSKSIKVAKLLDIPRRDHPVKEFGALRVLEYPIGAIANRHTDFDLFTLMCYRNLPELFEYESNRVPLEVLEAAPQTHFGEILEILDSKFKALPHQVNASLDQVQYSIVYFAIPEHELILPTGLTVKNWLIERLSRSRVY